MKYTINLLFFLTLLLAYPLQGMAQTPPPPTSELSHPYPNDSLKVEGLPTSNQPDSNYTFKNLAGRTLVFFLDPACEVEESGKIAYTFVIDPEGNVKRVAPPFTSFLELSQCTRKTIMKWKFNPILPEKGDQMVQVVLQYHAK